MLSSILTGLLAATCLTTARVIDRNGPQNEARQSAAEYEGYMFAYFTGNTVDGEKIRFAASNGNNALDWAELNGGQPVLTSTKGTTGLRDVSNTSGLWSYRIRICMVSIPDHTNVEH